MAEFGSPAALEGLAVEAVEWLPSGAESGLVRVRGRWIEPAHRQADLPALVLRRGEETRRFESLPDARFGRDPAVWRATYLVPAALMDPQPDELSLSWESGARAGLPAPARGFEPPAIPASAPVPEPEGEVIGRAVLAERRARRAEAAERAQAQRAAEALKAVEVLELRSAELERRLEAVQSEPASVVEAARDRLLQAEPLPAADAAAPTSPAAPAESAPAPDSAAAALTEAVAEVKRLRFELGEQRQRLRQSEMLRAADAVALATYRQDAERARSLQAELTARERELAAALADAEAAAREAAAVREQASEQVSLAAQRAATDAAAVRSRAAAELAAARTELEDTARELDAERAAHARTSATLASRERELSAIGADLTGVRTELATVRHDASERAGELERRLADLQAALEAERRAHGIAATERETAQAGLALAESARTAETVARAALDEELDRERAAIATLTAALEAAQAELTAAQTTQSDLVLSREQTRAELAAAQARAASAEAEVAAANERAAAAAATAQAEVAAGNERAEAVRGELAAANARAAAVRGELAAANERAAAVRGELDAALGRAASAEAEVAAANERAAAVRGEVDAALGRAASAEAPAAGVREELAAAQAALAAARASIADLERRLETERGAAGREAGGLLARIAELERAGDNDLDRRAREQETAATAVPRPDGDDRRELTASFDAAAAALKARPADEPAEPASAPAPAAAVQPAPADEPAEPASAPAPAAAVQPAPADEPAEPASTSPPAARPQPAPAPPAADRPARPRIVTEAKHPPRGDIVGSSKRQYPWLRGALVKLAHDDPRAATRLVLGLVPAQRALLQPPLEYDLTIRDSGTYAISITEQGASARSVGGPRSRDEAVFHASADIVTLTELLAGVEKRMGRWIGSVKVHGRRRHAEALRGALAGAGLDLAAAARAGADLEPDLVFRAFAYAIHPSWTKGHTFTVAQEIAGPRPLRWHVAVRDGRPISVERRAPAQPPDAVVSMTRLAFTHLLRGEQPPSGERPAIRGDGAAVAVLKSWTDRAQGRA